MKRCLRPQQNPPRFSDSGTCDEFLIMQRLEEKYSTGAVRFGNGDRRPFVSSKHFSTTPTTSKVMVKCEPFTPGASSQVSGDSRFDVFSSGYENRQDIQAHLQTGAHHHPISFFDLKFEKSGNISSAEFTDGDSPSFKSDPNFQTQTDSHVPRIWEKRSSNCSSTGRQQTFALKQTTDGPFSLCKCLPPKCRSADEILVEKSSQIQAAANTKRLRMSQESRWAAFGETEMDVECIQPVPVHVSSSTFLRKRCQHNQTEQYSEGEISHTSKPMDTKSTNSETSTLHKRKETKRQTTGHLERRPVHTTPLTANSVSNTLTLHTDAPGQHLSAENGRNICKKITHLDKTSSALIVGRTSSVHKLFVAEGCSVSSDSAKTHYPVSARQKLTSSNDVEVMPVKDSSTTRIQKMLKTFEGESEKRQKTQQVCSASGDTTRTTPTLITEQDNSVITDVSGLSTAERSKLGEQMKAYRHTGWLLLFEDNSTSSNGSLLKPGTQPVKGLLFHADERTYLFPLVCEREILKWIRSTLASILRTDKISKVALNSKNLMVALLRDFAVGNQREASRWQFEDPAVAGWLLRPDNPPQTIQDLCDMTGLDLFTSGSLDAQLHVELVVVMERLRGQLMEQRLWQLFHCVEMPLTPLLAVMELQAITINVQAFVNFSDILKKKLERLECKAHELAGHPFSINSTQQLRQLLYEELCLDQKLPAHSKVTLTATTHHKSTSEPMLRQLMETHPLPAVILEHRQLLKLRSTYIDGIVEAMEGGELRTHWDQTAAATGRLTSTHPNLQAIPKAPTVISDFEDNYIVGAESKTVEIYAREPYVCNEGNVFLAADFQQVELRLLAHLTNDVKLKKVFHAESGADVFMQLTGQWLGKNPSDVSSKEREQTKRVVYSIMYGVGKDRLAEYLKVSPSKAKDIMDSFLVTFPAIQGFTRRCIDYAKRHGYTESILGRRRWVPKINHHTPQVRAQAERQAVNFCVQGSAADVCKCAMLKVEQALCHRPHLTARLLIHIHDELLWELPADQLKETSDLIREVMEDTTLCQPILQSLRIPLTVTLSSGTSWAHLSPCQ